MTIEFDYNLLRDPIDKKSKDWREIPLLLGK